MKKYVIVLFALCALKPCFAMDSGKNQVDERTRLIPDFSRVSPFELPKVYRAAIAKAPDQQTRDKINAAYKAGVAQQRDETVKMIDVVLGHGEKLDYSIVEKTDELSHNPRLFKRQGAELKARMRCCGLCWFLGIRK